MDKKPLKKELVANTLRALYSSYGYGRYRMSNFEEYSFYLKNKNFLTSDKIIAFNDLDGRLMALKPDVTLSIVKNAKPGDKLYYVENVYRSIGVSYREISHMGLETLGNIDVYVESEVLTLAAKSLFAVDKNAVLEISHVALVNALLDEYINAADKKEVLQLLSRKNINEALEKYPESAECLTALFSNNLSAVAALLGEKGKEYMDELNYLLSTLSSIGARAEIDFSLVNDERYYNGVTFRGYVEKVPRPVLSGGRYDKLLAKMKKDFGGMGFALYLDELTVYDEREEYDCDCLVRYEKTEASYMSALSYAEKCRAEGKTVRVSCDLCGDLRVKETVSFDQGGKKC